MLANSNQCKISGLHTQKLCVFQLCGLLLQEQDDACQCSIIWKGEILYYFLYFTHSYYILLQIIRQMFPNLTTRRLGNNLLHDVFQKYSTCCFSRYPGQVTISLLRSGCQGGLPLLQRHAHQERGDPGVSAETEKRILTQIAELYFLK